MGYIAYPMSFDKSEYHLNFMELYAVVCGDCFMHRCSMCDRYL